MPFTGVVFGNRAIELAGRVVRPDYQQLGAGSEMLKRYISTCEIGYLTTYTRNPSVIQMLQRVCDVVYPLHGDDRLRGLALDMRHASPRGAAVYHLDRYGEDGLFGDNDPADRRLRGGACSLKEHFMGLQSVRNALIIAARIRKESI